MNIKIGDIVKDISEFALKNIHLSFCRVTEIKKENNEIHIYGNWCEKIEDVDNKEKCSRNMYTDIESIEKINNGWNLL